VVAVANDINEGSQAFASTFGFLHQSITHQNQVNVEKNGEPSGGLLVQNYLVKVEGDKLVKVTEIQLADRIVKIVDTFTLLPKPESEPEAHANRQETTGEEKTQHSS
jgi:hypothetical protein